MSFPDVRALVRHRAPALVVDVIESADRDDLTGLHVGAGPLSWCAILDATAQAAGLLCGVSPLLGPIPRVVATYDDVEPRVAVAHGPIRFRVRRVRVVLGMVQFAASAERLDGEVLLTARLTLAPAPNGA